MPIQFRIKFLTTAMWLPTEVEFRRWLCFDPMWLLGLKAAKKIQDKHIPTWTINEIESDEKLKEYNCRQRESPRPPWSPEWLFPNALKVHSNIKRHKAPVIQLKPEDIEQWVSKLPDGFENAQFFMTVYESDVTFRQEFDMRSVESAET